MASSLKHKDSSSDLSASHWDAHVSHLEADEPQAGVKTVEAAEKVYGKYSKWFLFLG